MPLKGYAAAVEDDKRIESLEKINADLAAQKAKDEPFDQKKVKIDLESLGLDPIKESEKTAPTNPPANAAIQGQQPTSTLSEQNLAEPEKAPNAGSTSTSTVLSKIQNLLHRTKSPDQKEEREVVKTEGGAAAMEPVTKPSLKPSQSTEKYLASRKKLALKKRLAAEKRAAENAKKQQEKLKKLSELRRKYLISVKPREDSNEDVDEDLIEQDENIIPRKKDLNRFISHDPLPSPILDRYRTSDNVHIPIIPTKEDRINVLFNSIVNYDKSHFENAYKDIDQPNLKNASGDTLLTYALLMRQHTAIASILEKGADPDLQNALGYRPLAIAIEMLDLRSVNLLIDSGSDINYFDKFGKTYLMQAARL